ncbi:MAG TPA: hypothetical protein VGE39_00310 [Prosthecobacter sp.]
MPFSQLAVVAVSTVGSLLLLCLIGHLLVPGRLLAGPKMLRLAVVMSSGLLITTGLAALVCLRHMHVTTWLALAQVLGGAVWTWRTRKTSVAPSADVWTRGEILSVLGIGAAFGLFTTLPNVWWTADGGIRTLHEDMGFYVSQVVALPESHAANPWSIFMGAHTLEATGIQDTWYHWGSMLLATGIHAVTGMGAAPALLLVTSGVLNFILMVVAAALAESLWRLRPATAALAGAGALISVPFVRLLPVLLGLLDKALPFDVFHHMRVTLALTLPYKYEGVLLLLTLVLWQARHPRLALAALYSAACSAPHSVAVVGAATGTLTGMGVLLRDGRMLRTGLSATGVTLAGWATMQFVFGAGLGQAQGAPAMGFAPLAEIPQVLAHAGLDIPATALMAAFFVAGGIFLARQAHEKRLLGWLCLCAVAGSTLALHALRCGDRFHVVMLTHSVLVMPVGALGLLGMVRLLAGWKRLAAVSALACVVALGLHTQISPLLTAEREVWTAKDLAGLREELQGRPFGYFAKNDRMWWISKHAMLGGLIDSRAMRLNPQDERASIHYSAHNCTLPLRWLPPQKDELTNDWSLRLAQKLGVRHVLETWQDRLPKRVREKCRPIWSGAGLMLYELPAPATEAGPAEEVAAR